MKHEKIENCKKLAEQLVSALDSTDSGAVYYRIVEEALSLAERIDVLLSKAVEAEKFDE